MTPTSKSKKDTTRGMRDVSDLPPSTFALPDDGRQAKHLQRQRKEVAVQLAKPANADGTNSYSSAGTMAKAMGCHRTTIFRLLKDLKTLGFLHGDKLHGFYKTVVRDLDISYMKTVASPVASSPDSPVLSSESPVASSQPPVASSPNTRSIFEGHPSYLHTSPVASPCYTTVLKPSNNPSF